MLSDGKWGVNGVCVTFAFVSLTIIKSHRPHLPSLSISARLFCPGNAPIELPAEEARFDEQRLIWYVCRLWDMVFS